MINPEYSENLIVGIINNNSFSWYVLNKLVCLLDLSSLSSEEYKLYMNNNLCNDIRKDFLIIDKDNIDIFLPTIDNYIISCERLQLMILNILEESNTLEIDDLFPVLLFNFDNKTLYSQYPEYFDFETFLPSNWNYKYNDFTNLIKNEDRYWIYKGKNLFEIISQRNKGIT